MELSVGDVVVVPALGVGTVETKQAVDVGDRAVPAYRIDLGPDDGAYWIPEARLGQEGLRQPMAADEVADVLDTLGAQEAPVKRANWNRRRKRYDEMIAANDPAQLAALIGELVAVQVSKKEKKQTLSFGERRLLEKTRRMLVEEIAAATGDDVGVVDQRIDAVLATLG